MRPDEIRRDEPNKTKSYKTVKNETGGGQNEMRQNKTRCDELNETRHDVI